MAAPETGIGSGLHFHVSLWHDNAPASRMPVGADLPDVLQQSIAGLLDALPEMAPLLHAPYPNSYKRYAPHSFAPVNYTWGYDNRTCAVRVAGRREHTRLEVRLAGAHANPYLALAAILASIFHGITKLGVLAMDASPAALALARWQGSGSNLHYAQHDFDARAIPPSLRPGTFDVIMCRNTLPYLDRERFLVDAARWLTPKGQLHLTIPVTSPHAPPPPPWARGLTVEQIRSLGAGWTQRTDYPLDAGHVCIVLSGQADPPAASTPARWSG